MQPGLPEGGLLTHCIPLLIDVCQPLSHAISLALGGAVLCQVAAHHIDAHGHTLVTVQVQEKLSVVLDHLLQLLDTLRNPLRQYRLRKVGLSFDV